MEGAENSKESKQRRTAACVKEKNSGFPSCFAVSNSLVLVALWVFCLLLSTHNKQS